MSVNNYQSTLRNIPEERRSKYLSFRWKTQKQQNTKSPVQAYSYARAVCIDSLFTRTKNDDSNRSAYIAQQTVAKNSI